MDELEIHACDQPVARAIVPCSMSTKDQEDQYSNFLSTLLPLSHRFVSTSNVFDHCLVIKTCTGPCTSLLLEAKSYPRFPNRH